jgi:hypothetical protein
MRRAEGGVEFYDIKWTGFLDDDDEFHGHPASYVPATILRRFRDGGRITAAEYRRFVNTFAIPHRT